MAQKQDKISAGDDIVINNNEISCTIKPDEQTIIRKNNGTMQCIGQLTKSNTLKFDWEGTQAEYNVAYLNGTIQPDWYCYITDDEQFVDYDDVCNKSLSNLRPDGEARFDAKLNLNLDNINEEGEKKLNISKMYYTNDVYTEEKGYNQLLEMRRSTFDKSKFTVVGSPTITDDGIASGFSTLMSDAKYISVPIIQLGQANSWKATHEFTTGSVSQSQWIYTLTVDEFYGGYTIGILNEKLVIRAGSTNDSTNNLFNLQTLSVTANTKYYVSIEFTGTQYIVNYKINDGELTNYATIDTNTHLYNSLTSYYIGRRDLFINTQEGFLGSIDLKKFSITVDGKEVFNGNKTGLDVIKPDNYEVVGSPVITDDGVASGFSGSNSISIYKTFSSTDNCVAIFKFKINYKVASTPQPIMWFYAPDSLGRNMYLSIDNNKGITTALYDLGYISSASNIFTTEKEYDIKYETDFATYFKVYVNNTQIINQTISISETKNIARINLGNNSGDNIERYFTGSIDLNSFKIYVDGNLVYQPCLKIPYTQSKTGSKIVDVAYRDRVIDLYEQEGKAKYYTIDEPNKNFTLPMGEIYGMIEDIKNTKSGGSGLEIGDIGMALYVDETKGLRRYLNGQIVDINTNTQAFLNRLKEITTLHPSLLCTEEEWQTAKTMSAFGQVGKFVFNYNGADIVSVRLPRLVNVQGLFDLQNLGMTVSAGLPNINAQYNAASSSYGGAANHSISNPQGAIYEGSTLISGATSRTNYNSSDAVDSYPAIFDASRLNSVYGNSETVQPEAIQYPYFIQIATGSETEANIVNTLENVNGFTLLESKYSDKPLYNESWLLSNGQYNPKATYPTAYEGLQVEYNTEIEAGTTVTLPSGVSYTKRGLSVKLSTETYTDYDFVLNTAEEKFRLPLKTLHSDDTVDSFSLYFYVGDLDQNHGIVNMGRIGELVATKTDMLQASGAGMPSNRYIDLTLGESGTVYTAPANGYFVLVKVAWTSSTTSVDPKYIEAINQQTNFVDYSTANYQFACCVSCPAKKNETVYIGYDCIGNTMFFGFIYAEGAKND